MSSVSLPIISLLIKSLHNKFHLIAFTVTSLCVSHVCFWNDALCKPWAPFSQQNQVWFLRYKGFWVRKELSFGCALVLYTRDGIFAMCGKFKCWLYRKWSFITGQVQDKDCKWNWDWVQKHHLYLEYDTYF